MAAEELRPSTPIRETLIDPDLEDQAELVTRRNIEEDLEAERLTEARRKHAREHAGVSPRVGLGPRDRTLLLFLLL